MRKWFRPAPRLAMVSDNVSLLQQWQQDIRASQIPIRTQAFSYPLQEGPVCQAIVLLQPTPETLEQLPQLQERHPKAVLVVLSSNEAYRAEAKENGYHFLPGHTHPLELARLLVEKLDLPATTRKSFYVPSFFQY